MLKLFLLVIVTCIVTAKVTSQNISGVVFFEELTTSQGNQGVINVYQESGISDLVGIHIESNKRNRGVDGYRIQLYLSADKNAKKEATEVKSHLLSLWPNEKVYVKYEAPFWRVQVGDFRSKNESLILYKKLKKEFPSCYPVPVNNIDVTSLE